jgi:hypothetical protein
VTVLVFVGEAVTVTGGEDGVGVGVTVGLGGGGPAPAPEDPLPHPATAMAATARTSSAGRVVTVQTLATAGIRATRLPGVVDYADAGAASSSAGSAR